MRIRFIVGSRWRTKNLMYKISKYPTGLNKQEVDKEIANAFGVWSGETDLTFTRKTGHENVSSYESRYISLIHADNIFSRLGSHRNQIRSRRARRRWSFRWTWRHLGARVLSRVRRWCSLRRLRTMDHQKLPRYQSLSSRGPRIRPLARLKSQRRQECADGTFLPWLRSTLYSRSRRYQCDSGTPVKLRSPITSYIRGHGCLE